MLASLTMGDLVAAAMALDRSGLNLPTKAVALGFNGLETALLPNLPPTLAVMGGLTGICCSEVEALSVASRPSARARS